jgi:hypothetical protein
MNAENKAVAAEATTETKPQEQPTLRWDDTRMQTSYANVVNVTSTREEMSLFFGTNQTWNVGEDKQVMVQLNNRIVLNPYAAKRLALLVTGVLKEYESRFGRLSLD